MGLAKIQGMGRVHSGDQGASSVRHSFAGEMGQVLEVHQRDCGRVGEVGGCNIGVQAIGEEVGLPNIRDAKISIDGSVS